MLVKEANDSKIHGANMTQVGPMLALWTLLSGKFKSSIDK